MLNCFVISCPGEAQRRDHIRSMLSNHKLPFRFFDGIRGATQDPVASCENGFISSGLLDESLDNLDVFRNQIGCAKSHTNLWVHVMHNLDKAHFPVLIMEDDVELEDNFVERTQLLLEEIPLDTDIVYLGSTAESDSCEKFSSHLDRAKHPRGLFAYLIWQHGAANILKQILPLRRPIDECVSDLISNEQLKAFVANPALAHHPYMFDSIIWSGS